MECAKMKVTHNLESNSRYINMGETPKMVGFPNLHPKCWSFLEPENPMEIVGVSPTIIRKHPYILTRCQQKKDIQLFFLSARKIKMTSTQAPMFIPLPPGLADLRSSTASMFVSRSCARCWWVFAGGVVIGVIGVGVVGVVPVLVIVICFCCSSFCCDYCSWFCYWFCYWYFYLVLCYRVIAVVISVFVASFVAPAVVVANIEKSFASSTLKGESKRVCLSDKMTRYF